MLASLSLPTLPIQVPNLEEPGILHVNQLALEEELSGEVVNQQLVACFITFKDLDTWQLGLCRHCWHRPRDMRVACSWGGWRPLAQDYFTSASVIHSHRPLGLGSCCQPQEAIDGLGIMFYN